MEQKVFHLKELVNPPHTDSISGRGFGEEYSISIGLMNLINKKFHIVFVIDSVYVKAINDSFIKGLFNEVFKSLKTVDNVNKVVEIDADDYYKRLFYKNWLILQDIYNV